VEIDLSGSSETIGEVSSENVSFIDNDEGISLPEVRAVNSVAQVDGTTDLQLGNFLSRPTLIDTYTWSTSDTSGLVKTIQPWYLFLNNSNIKKKIDNFAFVRGTLHVKMVLNGTPFQYGLMRACYYPMMGHTTHKIRDAPTPMDAIVPYSQMHGVYLTPSANAGGTMELPFILNRNWLNLSSAGDVQNMGSLNFVQVYPLSVAVTGGSTIVTIQTFAWMTDVELMCTTSSLSLQGDEYVEGPISGPATALASVASSLTKVPIIGKFARATQIGSQAVGSMARLFGFTNTPVIEPVHGFMPLNGPMLASAHIGTAAQKLTFDPKQELSIDPKLHGCSGEDELAISYLKKRESILAIGSWATSDAVDTNLFSMLVTPAAAKLTNIVDGSSVIQGTRVLPTPLAWLSAMFASWRGSIKIRVKVVCSKFHKGRLKVSFDPKANLSTTNPDINTVYTEIIDIGEQDDVVIEIPYHQATAWLGMSLYKTVSTFFTTGGSLSTLNIDGFCNGTLSIRVLTSLTAPVASSVGLVISIAGGDDLEFANPRNVQFEGDTPPSLLALQGAEKVDLTPTTVVLGSKTAPSADRYGLNFGECISSLRNLLHRSSLRNDILITDLAASSINVVKADLRIMPPSPGFQTYGNAVVSKFLSAGTANAWISPMHPMTYITAPFLGYRGGSTFTITPNTDLLGSLQDLRVVRQTTYNGYNAYQVGATAYTVPDSGSNNARICGQFKNQGKYNSGAAGMAITNTNTNGSLVFNLPDYKIYNFGLVGFSSFGVSGDGTRGQIATAIATISTNATSDLKHALFQIEQCAGPDFMAVYFVCVPTFDIPLYDYTAA